MIHAKRPSMRQLADAAGVNTQTVIDTVLGRVNPRHETVAAIATALRQDVRVIAEWVGQARSVRAPWNPPAEADQLTERQRRALDELIRAIAEGGGHRGDTAPTITAAAMKGPGGAHVVTTSRSGDPSSMDKEWTGAQEADRHPRQHSTDDAT